jgi:hypothetical protein
MASFMAQVILPVPGAAAGFFAACN